jgi:hypothetical protein
VPGTVVVAQMEIPALIPVAVGLSGAAVLTDLMLAALMAAAAALNIKVQALRLLARTVS